MTDTQALHPEPEQPFRPPQADAWGAAFARLRERFPKAKDTILFCAHVLQQGDEPELEDLKAQAAMHGLRITAASLQAARNLLDPGHAPTRRTRKVKAAPPAEAPRETTPTTPRGRPASPKGLAAIEPMIRQIVATVEAESEARVARMRRAIEEVLEVIDDVLG